MANSLMRRRRKRPSRQGKVGKAPGTLVFLGDQREGGVTIREFSFNANEYREDPNVASLPSRSIVDSKIRWIDVVGVHDADTIHRIGQHFQLHPLTQEDIMNTCQRPKTEMHDDYLFIVVKMISFLPGEAEVATEQVSFVVGRGWLITFQEDDDDVFEIVRERIRQDKGKVRKAGADYLAYALIDAIVDHYFLVLEEFGDRIETLEEALIEGRSSQQIVQLQMVKHEIIALRKNIWPLREVVNNFLKTDSDLVSSHTKPYLQDLYDHTIQIIDTIESYRDIIAGVQDLYLSVVNNKMNEVMKVLALISTIFMPMTLVAGIYGMNFKNMPELETTWGYPVAMGLMATIGISMFILFKRRNWL
jgi:magnesium transporter